MIHLTGIFEFIAALALLTQRSRWWAGLALAVYIVCVWPANIKHAFMNVDVPGIPSSWWYHGPRLAAQPVLAWWALFCAGVIDWPWRRR